MDTNSGLTARPDTEKKRSEDEANRSSATTAITTSRDIVNEIGKVPENVPESLPISRGENLDDSFAEATQEGNMFSSQVVVCIIYITHYYVIVDSL